MINVELLKKHLEDGYVISQKHPTLDLTIYNYSQFAQYENVWDEVTLMCRGLILDSNYNIIQRPFGKFFNMDEHVSEFKPDIPNLPFEVFDKMDGSLGILYWDGDIPKIASRGSFTSEQAIKGTEMLEDYLYLSVCMPDSTIDVCMNLIDKTKTYVFEIIYPENRIVVDYGSKEELVLLAVIDTETGEDYCITEDRSYIGFPIVDSYDGIKDFKQLQALNTHNKEGFVVKFSNGFRMKLKFDEYCRLHRIITNVTSYDIWDCLRNGTGFDEILNKVPDEFYDWVADTKNALLFDFENLKDEYDEIHSSLSNIVLDKEFAEKAKEYTYPHLLFNLRKWQYDRFEDSIWKLVKPKYEKPFSKK